MAKDKKQSKPKDGKKQVEHAWINNDEGKSGASDLSHVAIAFDNNRLAVELFGKFEEHLALLETELGITAIARGNKVELRGSDTAVENARLALDSLYTRLQNGHGIENGDVAGAIRMVNSQEKQLPLPEVNKGSKLSLATVSTSKKTISARSPTQDAYIRAMDRAELVFGVGPAGTGKTYLAVAYAAALLERGVVDRIILSRPAVEAGERLGFLPGDMKDKVDPYLRPLYDALYDMIPGEKVERALELGIIEIAPLAFMRGRTLSNAIVILDEAQNTSSMQMKMFLTRLGEGSKMFITGDPTQIDLPRGQVSGLVEALKVLENVKKIIKVEFTSKDVVRHPLVSKIVDAYDRVYKEKNEESFSA